ncbi:la autoantigen-like [Lasioglossum baleicum]|uniref:la autoantigen-like n=1 Tax=Lasioglossum baleicum TaxID=434251 RepID=UPI003FCE3E56
MENGKVEVKTDIAENATADKVACEKPVKNVEECSVKVDKTDEVKCKKSDSNAEENSAKDEVKEEVTCEKPVSNAEEKSMEVEENSAEVEEKSTKVEEKSTKVEEKSTKVEEKSTKVEEKSTKVEEKSSKVEEKSTKVEEKSTKVEEKSIKVEEPSSELLTKIKNQVEFYFGDVNMQRDKFLIEQTKLDEGWVPMTIMFNFKMLASMSKDANVVLKALESSELIEVSEDKKKIRRSTKHPLPVYNEEYRKAQEARTVYVKGFPVNDTNIEKLKNFFNAYEPFENIIMRKYNDSDKKLRFKGSIFIQFKTLEDAKAFMAREPMKYGDTELIKKWSVDYCAFKAKEKEDRKQKRSEQKAKKNDTGKEKDDVESGEENKKESSLPKGCVIHFSNVPEDCSREDIKERLGELQANIAFVDFKIGDKEGWVRLQGENTAKTVVDKMQDSKVLIHEKEVVCRILEGEEEDNYLAKAKVDMTNSRQKFEKLKRSGRKGRNAQRGQRKRRNSDTNDGFQFKKKALE